MQNPYPVHQVDVKLSDGDDNMLKESTGDDAVDGGATSAEHIAPNSIGSNVVGQAHPLVADRIDATAPSADGQKRKHPRLPLSASNPKLHPIR
jgi:hypothetical protein